MVLEAADKKSKSRPDHLWPEMWSGISKAAQRREKAATDLRETETRQCWKVEEASFFVVPEDKEFKETIKHARKKLELPNGQTISCGPGIAQSYSTPERRITNVEPRW